MRGRVAALVGPEQVVVKEFDVAEPEPGSILLRIRRANICGSEVHMFHYRHPLLRRCVLGHEFVGEIVALGEGVEFDYAGSPVAVGDRVIPVYFITCRRCPACLVGEFNMCHRAYDFWSQAPEVAPHFHGGFGTHYYIRRDQYFFKVPEAVPDSVVAGANCGLSQVLFGLHKGGLTAGDNLVVQGAGGLGLYAMAVARDAGARVIAVEGIPERIDFARRFGAEEIVDMREYETSEARVQRVQELVGGQGPDMVIEVSGAPPAFLEAIHLVRPGGTIVEIGNVSIGPEHEVSIAPGLITRKMLRIQAAMRYQPWFLHRSLRFLERRHRDHPFDELTDQDYGLEEVGEAIELAEGRRVARPAVVPA